MNPTSHSAPNKSQALSLSTQARERRVNVLPRACVLKPSGFNISGSAVNLDVQWFESSFISYWSTGADEEGSQPLQRGATNKVKDTHETSTPRISTCKYGRARRAANLEGVVVVKHDPGLYEAVDRRGDCLALRECTSWHQYRHCQHSRDSILLHETHIVPDSVIIVAVVVTDDEQDVPRFLPRSLFRFRRGGGATQ